MTTGAPLYLVTACSSPEEFVAAFRRYTDRTGLFVPCATPLPAGKRGRVAMTLRDGGVMLEGEVDVVSSSAKPSALYGRTGMTLRFVEPDEPSKTLLGELERARIALKPVPPTIGPRAADVPAAPRPTAPAPGGRIDAANALAETIPIGDVTRLRDVGSGSSAGIALGAAGAPSAVTAALAASDSGKLGAAGAPPKAAQKFVMPAIPGKPGTKPPPLADPKPADIAKPPQPGLDVRLAEAMPADAKPVPATPLADAAARAAEAAKVAAEAAKRAAEVAKAAADAADAARPSPRPAPKPVADKPSAPVAAAPAPAPKPGPAAKPAPAAPAPSQPKPAATKSVTATQPSAVVPPPAKPAPAPRPAAPPAAKPKPMLVVVDPDEATDLSEIPPTAEPFTPFDAPSDAIPEPAHADTRKTSLGMSAVLVLPAPPERRVPKITEPPSPGGPRDTALMDAEPGGVVGPASVDAHGETLPPGAMSFDMLAAATGLQGDWTMAPDEDAPVPLVTTTPPTPPPAPAIPVTPPAPPAPLSGDWIISTDAGAEDGWSAPSKVNKRAATNAGVGPPLLEVASSEPLSSEPKKEPAREDTGPKVQIDPTLIEALPDLARLEAAASGPLVPPGPISSPLIAPPPPPDDPQLQPMLQPMPPLMTPPPMMAMAPPPNDFSVDVAFGQTGAALQPYGVMPLQQQPMMPNPMGLVTTPGVGPAGQLGMLPQPGMMPPQPPMGQPYGMMNPAGLATTPGVGPYDAPPFGAVDPSGMPIPPGTVPTNMSPLGGMVPLPPPAPGAPQSFTPLPGFAPPVSAAFVVPELHDPAQAAMPSAVQLATGDSTAVLHSRRRWIIAAVVLVLLAIAGGVYLVLTTGGGRGEGPATPSTPPPPGSAAAAQPPDDHAGSALAPPQVADAAVPPTPGSASAVATPPTTPPKTPAPGSAASDGTCTVKIFSVPTGADVSVDEKVVGKTPGTVDLPCNVEAKLVFRKAPFIAGYRVITPTADGDNTARVALARVQLQLKVSSSPAGAAITINGKAAGVTPSSVKVNGFETSTIVLAKPGFDPYTEKVTPRTNGETVHAQLKRAKK